MLEDLLAQFGYLALFGFLVAAGLGVPLPEEATQLAGGVLAHQGLVRLLPAMATAWAGIVTGDVIWFTLARRHGERVLAARPVARVLSAERRAGLERHLARHAFLVVAAARHASGLRLAVFALAATHGVRLRTFALADGLSALVSVPLVVGAGFLFSQHLELARRDLRWVELAVVALVVVGILVATRLRRRPARR